MIYCKLRAQTACMLVLSLCGFGLAHAPASATEVAGNAVSVAQKATISNAEGRRTMASGMSVAMGDRINTDGNGQVELIFTDETKLVVGPNSSMVIESYLLRSGNRANNFTVRALGGSFRFITGKSEKAAYKIKTPTATIGVRGTSFDIAVRRAGVTNVVLFSGQAQVCSRAGCVTLEQTCGLATAPRKDPARVIRDRNSRGRSIADQFPYIRSQESLSSQFRVEKTGCSDVTKAAIRPPSTTAAIGRKPDTDHVNDTDPDEPSDEPSGGGRGEPGSAGKGGGGL